MTTLLIGLVFCLGFFVESIIGFGGSLVAFSILGFFLNIKEMIVIAIYIATSASIFVIASDYKSFNGKIFLESFPACFIGTILGIISFTLISSERLLIAFATFLIILALKVMFFDNIKFPKIFTKFLLLIGGFSQGIFGIGGPFFSIALRSRFHNKSEARSTLAIFFIAFNIVRVIWLCYRGKFVFQPFLEYWWTVIPLIIAIHLGHIIHGKISEKTFKNMVAGMAFLAGIEFLLK
jgi:uncharacterized membrane protein YfcA